MKCAINIGNTHIAIALKKDNKLIKVERYKTKEYSNLKEFEHLVQSFFAHININELKAVIVASVVPNLDTALALAIKNTVQLCPIMLGRESFDKLNFDYSAYAASSLGIDRLIISYLIKKKYKLPAIALDFGTATTFNVLDTTGAFLGGVIIPGMHLWLNSLYENTALLNGKTSLAHVPTCIGKNTFECISIGSLQGMGLLIDGLLKKIDAQFEMGLKSIVATGGGAEYILPYCNNDIYYDKEMLFEGIFLVHKYL